MGTRCLTAIKSGDKDSDEICVVYRQMDGYPDGHGMDLKKLFGKTKIVNGFGDDTTVANGMDCFAAQVVTKLKVEVQKHHRKMLKWLKKQYPEQAKNKKTGMAGNIYLMAANTRNCWEDYLYTLYLVTKGKDDEEYNPHESVGEIHVMVQSSHYTDSNNPAQYETIYDGPLKDFSPDACKHAEEEETQEVATEETKDE